jgi:hypothetical protein
MYWRVLVSAFALLATNYTAASSYSHYVNTTDQEAVLYFPDGSVTVDNTTSEIIVQLQSGFSHQFTFSEVASDLSSSPAETSQILNELHLAIASPGVARSFHSENPDPDWGLPSSSIEPPPGEVIPYSPSKSINGGSGSCLLGDPLCSSQCDLVPCNPFMGYGGMGPGYSLQMDGGYSEVFGDTPAERECAAQHYRDWLETQGGVCENAAAEGALAVGAGSVALGSCMQFNRAPNQANGLVCAGSYVVLLIQGWRASNATDDCLAEYPGPGNEC